MLAEITIRNLAVIERLQVSFRNGFHVLTGETGTGKSIVIDALTLIAGGRGSAELVRHGSERAEIEAMFELPNTHPVWRQLAEIGVEADHDEPLIIKRSITSAGKSNARINGQLVNLSMLRDVGEFLVNIHGQHEHQSLLKTERHIDWLDAYGEAQISAVKSAYQLTYEKHRAVAAELRELQSGVQQALQMLDLYKFQSEEIAAAALAEGEEEQLETDRRKLANAGKLMDAVADAYERVYGGGQGLEQLSAAMDKLEYAVPYDEQRLQPLFEQIQGAYYQLEDASFQLRAYRDELEFEPERLNDIEARLDALAGLKRKYGPTIADILLHYAKINEELERVEHKDERLAELTKQSAELERKLKQQALKLTAARKAAAAALAEEVEAHLRDLNMERTRFAVEFEEAEDGKLVFARNGADHVEFRISANPGEPLRALSKVASGGELSRIMLAMKSIFAAADQIPVVVFDEVDTGVSGRAAQAIAGKLAALSRQCQIFAVTHLPQVASMADGHYLIRKEVDGGRTYTEVDSLDGEERVKELARMLGGAKITDTTLKHAREMIELARQS